jgi:hypothetical protein
MGFWDLSDGQTATNTGTEYEVPSGNMDPIPAGSSVLAMIDECKWEMRQTGEEFISARWTVLAPEEYKNRKVFHKMWVMDMDPSAKDEATGMKKRDKARKMLAAIDANAGGKLTAKPGRPTNDDLLHLTNKPMVCTMMEWEMPDTRNGGTMRGNWVSAVASKGNKDIHIADAKPRSAAAGSGAARRDDFGAPAGNAPAGGYSKPAMMDDDIPFAPAWLI